MGRDRGAMSTRQEGTSVRGRERGARGEDVQVGAGGTAQAVTGRGAGKERRWLVSAQLATDVKKEKEGQRRERASHRLVTRGRGV